MPSTVTEHPLLSAEERALRVQAIAQARASVRLEGTILPVEIEELNRQYTQGDVSTAEYVKRVIEAADAMARKCVSRPGRRPATA